MSQKKSEIAIEDHLEAPQKKRRRTGRNLRIAEGLFDFGGCRILCQSFSGMLTVLKEGKMRNGRNRRRREGDLTLIHRLRKK